MQFNTNHTPFQGTTSDALNRSLKPDILCRILAHFWLDMRARQLILESGLFSPHFVGHCCVCRVQGEARANYLLPTGHCMVGWIFDTSEILVSQFRLSHSWSWAMNRCPRRQCLFFFLSAVVLGDKQGAWKHHSDTTLIADRLIAAAQRGAIKFKTIKVACLRFSLRNR